MFKSAAAVLLLALATACGGSTPPDQPGPTSPPDVAVAAPSPVRTISRDQMTRMVLTPADVAQEFTYLLDENRAGFFDQNAVAEHTIDPLDLGVDVSAQGFMAGYERSYTNTASTIGKTVAARVYLWSSPDEASEFLRRHIEGSHRHVGSQLDGGVLLKAFDQLNEPGVGQEAVASRFVGDVVARPGAEVTSTIVMWRRGALVAMTGILAISIEDQLPTISRLAHQMNDRMDDVLQGKVIAGALKPAQVSQTETNTPTPVAPAGPLDVRAMALALADLPAGVVVENEDLADQSDGRKSFQRTFKPEDEFIGYGSSQMMEIRVLVSETTSPDAARTAIQVAKSLGAQGVQKLADESSTATSTPRRIRELEIPQVGDDSTGLVSESMTPAGTFEAIVVHFSRDRIRGQLLLVGRAGDISADDVAGLAQLFDQKIMLNLPTPPS